MKNIKLFCNVEFFDKNDKIVWPPSHTRKKRGGVIKVLNFKNTLDPYSPEDLEEGDFDFELLPEDIQNTVLAIAQMSLEWAKTELQSKAYQSIDETKAMVFFQVAEEIGTEHLMPDNARPQ